MKKNITKKLIQACALAVTLLFTGLTKISAQGLTTIVSSTSFSGTYPSKIALCPDDGLLYVASWNSSGALTAGKVQRVSTTGTSFATIASCPAAEQINAVAFNPVDHNNVYVASFSHVYALNRSTLAWKLLCTFSAYGAGQNYWLGVTDIAFDASGNMYVVNNTSLSSPQVASNVTAKIYGFTASAVSTAVANGTALSLPSPSISFGPTTNGTFIGGLAWDNSLNRLYANYCNNASVHFGGSQFLLINNPLVAGGASSTALFGNATAPSSNATPMARGNTTPASGTSTFNGMTFFYANNNAFYFADFTANVAYIWNNANPSYGLIPIAGAAGTGAEADNATDATKGSMNGPFSVTVDPSTTNVYILDVNANTIRKISNSNAIVLPVSLLSFSAGKDNSSALLNWSTAQETNSKGFAVLRSTDGGKSFTEIGFVNSLGNGGNSSSQLDYSFTDASPASGLNIYELKQTDLDGNTTISKQVSVSFGTAVQLSLSPNPTASVLNISGASTAAKYQILTMDGRVVLQPEQGSKNISVSGLASGSYILRVEQNGVVQSLKFVNQ